MTLPVAPLRKAAEIYLEKFVYSLPILIILFLESIERSRILNDGSMVLIFVNNSISSTHLPSFEKTDMAGDLYP